MSVSADALMQPLDEWQWEQPTRRRHGCIRPIGTVSSWRTCCTELQRHALATVQRPAYRFQLINRRADDKEMGFDPGFQLRQFERCATGRQSCRRHGRSMRRGRKRLDGFDCCENSLTKFLP
jgi:hypothetical protein